MILFSILFFMAIYAAISIAFLVFVRSRTERPLYALLAVILIVLVPTWDMVLGAIVYFPSCLFFPKVAIYETAETEGIYYEGEHDYVWELKDHGRNEPVSERTVVGHIKDVFKRGYTYAESRVTKRETYWDRWSISPVFYHCVPLPRDPDRPAYQRTSCVVVDQVRSRYMVKCTAVRIGTAAIGIVKIIDRSTGRLMAKERVLSYYYTFPFFYWLYQFDAPAKSISCYGRRPFGVTGTYDTLAFDVLKPKK